MCRRAMWMVAIRQPAKFKSCRPLESGDMAQFSVPALVDLLTLTFELLTFN